MRRRRCKDKREDTRCWFSWPKGKLLAYSVQVPSLFIHGASKPGPFSFLFTFYFLILHSTYVCLQPNKQRMSAWRAKAVALTRIRFLAPFFLDHFLVAAHEWTYEIRTLIVEPTSVFLLPKRESSLPRTHKSGSVNLRVLVSCKNNKYIMDGLHYKFL